MAAPITAPESALTPEAISIATIGAPSELTASITRRGEPAYFGVEAGAEDRIDDGDGRLRVKRGIDRIFAQQFDDAAAGREVIAMRTRRVAFQIGGAREQGHSHLHAGLEQLARRDEPIAAVVAFARNDQHRRADCVRPSAQQQIGHGLTRPAHQGVRGDAVFLLAQAIEFAAFGGVQQNHRE